MKTSHYIILFIFFIPITSCCGLDYGDYQEKNNPLYSRKVSVADTSERILKISYKNSSTVFYPNDTSAELVISENKENTLYITTKLKTDTIVLNVKVSYGMSSSSCDAVNTYKYVEHMPIIINHTFDSAHFIFLETTNSYTDVLVIKP